MNARQAGAKRIRVEETSAGGFVLAGDGSNRVALIARMNRAGRLDWCVPKGHPEGSESIEEAALRELAEETGLVAEILGNLGQINYEFQAGDRRIAKTVHHFVMRQVGGVLTIENDPDQEATDVAWVELDVLEKTLAHENEKRMARDLIEWLSVNE